LSEQVMQMQADDSPGVDVDDELGANVVVVAPPISFTFVDDDQDDDGEHWPQPQQQAATAQANEGTNLGITLALASGGGVGSTGLATTPTATTAATTVVRPGTPPPRSLSLFTPTQNINLNSRRRVARGACDEVHPLAAATVSSSNNLANNLGRKSPAIALHQQHQAIQQGREGENDPVENTNMENSLEILVGNGNESSHDLSGSTKSSSSISRPQHLHRSCSTNTSTTADKTHPNNNILHTNQNKKINEKLNFKQRLAMENFLMAQSSKNMNPIAKEEAWRELVRAMKRSSSSEYDTSMNTSGSTTNNNNSSRGGGYARSNSSNNANGGRRNSLGGKKKDDILGLIRIGGGLKIGAGSSDVVSIASGLTTEHYETATTAPPPTTTATTAVNNTTTTPNLVVTAGIAAGTTAAGAASAAGTTATAAAVALVVVAHECSNVGGGDDNGGDDNGDDDNSFFLRSSSSAARSEIHRNALRRPLDKRLLFITCCRDEYCC